MGYERYRLKTGILGNMDKILKKFPGPGIRTRDLSNEKLGFGDYTTEKSNNVDRFQCLNLTTVSISKQAFVNKQMLQIGCHSSK